MTNPLIDIVQAIDINDRSPDVGVKGDVVKQMTVTDVDEVIFNYEGNVHPKADQESGDDLKEEHGSVSSSVGDVFDSL